VKVTFSVRFGPELAFGDMGNQPGELLGFCDPYALLFAGVRVGLRHLLPGSSVVRSQLEMPR